MEQGSLDFTPGRKAMTVTELTTELKGLIEKHFGLVWVEGEVSNFRTYGSGHSYFVLKDAGAQIKAVLFRNTATLLRFKLVDGQKLLVRARLSVYAERGDYQLVVTHAEPLGVGALQEAYRQLLEKLKAEGLFDLDRKVPIPDLPRKVGVITSPSGAAVRDIIRTVTRRSRLVDLLIAPAKVQGDGAAEEIARNLKLLDSKENPWWPLDVIIIGRGGGGIEDLWAFNEEVLARAVAACGTPVISAVGHEIDWVITDYVADYRAATPTAAAEMVSPLESDLASRLSIAGSRLARNAIETIDDLIRRTNDLRRFLPDPGRDLENKSLRLDDLYERMNSRLRERIAGFGHRVDSAGKMLMRTPILERIENRSRSLSAMEVSLKRAAARRADKSSSELESLKSRIEALNPMKVLERGYAIARRTADGKIVRSKSDLIVGDEVEIRVSDGAAITRVEKV